MNETKTSVGLNEQIEVSKGETFIDRARKGFEKNIATKGLDMIINISIALVFFLVPVFFTNLTAQGVAFDKLVLFYFLALIGIVAWVTKGVVKGELNIKRTPLDIPIVALLIVFVVSTLLSINVKDSFLGAYGSSSKSLIALIIFILFYYLVANNIDKNKLKLYFWAIISSSSLVIVYSIFQVFGKFILPFQLTKFTAFNPIGSLTALTMFITFIFPLLVVGVAQIKEIHPSLNNRIALIIKIILGIVSAAALALLALLNGFTFWPALIVGIVIVLMFFLSKIISISSNNLIIPIGAFLIGIVLLILGNFNIFNLNLPVEVNISRQQSWIIAKESVKNDPVFGSGLSTYYYDFSKYKGQEFNGSPLWNVRFDSASGSFFELLSTVGILGSLTVLIVVLIAISVAFLSIIKANIKEIDSIFLGFFASFVALLIFALLFALHGSIILISLLIFIMTISIAVSAYPNEFKELRLSFRTSAKYGLALAAVFLTVSAGVVILFTIGLKMYLADVYANKSVLNENIDKKIDYINKSIVLAPYQDNYLLTLSNLLMSKANQEAQGSKNQETIEQNLSQAIEVGKRGADMNPNRAGTNEMLALIYENASFYTRGALEWSEDYYKKVEALEPDNPVPYLRIALINLARANAETQQSEKEFDTNEAIKKFDEAIAKKSDFAAAYYGKAIADERLNKLDDAIEQLKKAVIIDRKNVDYRFELGRLFFNRGVAQPDLTQTASNDIAKGQENQDNLSVKPQPGANKGANNEDLKTAEQIFLDLVNANPNHANALYSLALVYQKTNQTDNVKLVVKKLLEVLQDEQSKELVKKQFPGMF
jgi:tetratricopeptide (TPR) repeat protein